MLKKIGGLGVLVILVAVPLLAIVWQTIFNSEVGMAQDIGIQEPPLTECDYSSVPQTVIDDAVELAGELIGKSQENIQNFTDQLVAMYTEVKDLDVIIIFNSGGMGWNLTNESPGWSSILDGITTSELNIVCQTMASRGTATSITRTPRPPIFFNITVSSTLF